MATALLLQLVPTPSRRKARKDALLGMKSWETFIATLGTALSCAEQQGDEGTWKKAKLIVDADQEARSRSDIRTKNLWRIRHKVSQDLRAWWLKEGVPHPSPSFLSHARKLYDVWSEVFGTSPKNLPFDFYRRIATSSLPLDQKHELRLWAETSEPKREALCQEIRDRVDATKGIYRPDFDLKVSNHWVFQSDTKREDGFTGGVNPELYANLIHAFSDPGQTVLDPFAGGGLLEDVLTQYRHFREATKAEHSGPRLALLSDIAPTRLSIRAGDARQSIPFGNHCAHLAILDPPYWTMATGKYPTLGVTLEEWMAGLQAVLHEVQRCLVAEGLVAVMTDDMVRAQRHEPLGLLVMGLLREEGWEPVTTVYNFNRNFTAMSPAEMARAKVNRLHVNAVKIIQVSRRPQSL